MPSVFSIRNCRVSWFFTVMYGMLRNSVLNEHQIVLRGCKCVRKTKPVFLLHRGILHCFWYVRDAPHYKLSKWRVFGLFLYDIFWNWHLWQNVHLALHCTRCYFRYQTTSAWFFRVVHTQKSRGLSYGRTSWTNNRV